MFSDLRAFSSWIMMEVLTSSGHKVRQDIPVTNDYTFMVLKLHQWQMHVCWQWPSTCPIFNPASPIRQILILTLLCGQLRHIYP